MKAKLINPIYTILKNKEVRIVRELDITDKLYRNLTVRKKIYITESNNIEDWHFAESLEIINEK